MASSFFALGIVSVLSDTRNFYPEELQLTSLRSKTNTNRVFNENRVWVRLNSDNGCFTTEPDVRVFKDYLLSQYECISFDIQRKQIYKHPASTDYSVWYLWLELNGDDFECLKKTIDLPQNIASSCIENVKYEPMLHNYYSCKSQDIEETNQALGVDLWSLDILDAKYGTFNKKYRYPLHIDGNADHDTKYKTGDPLYGAGKYKVEAIVLDSEVDVTHEEFSESDPESLLIGAPENTTEQKHATHVAGIMVGKNVGGAKKTKLLYYPVLQFGDSGTLADVEAGFEAAIEYMNQGAPGTRYVINLSAGDVRDPFVDALIESWGVRINQAGGIWVVAAGNNNSDACNFLPAFSSEALTVAAYHIEGGATSYTNFGECIDVWGPGGDLTVGPGVWSANRTGGYIALNGTSFASPNIASIVVNLLKMDNTLTLNDIKQYMKENARIVEDPVKGVMNQAYLSCKEPCSSNKKKVYDANGGGPHYGEIYNGNVDASESLSTSSTTNIDYLHTPWFIVIAMLFVNTILFWCILYGNIVIDSKASSMQHQSVKIDMTQS